MISSAPIGNTSWVCDLRWESHALEQAKRLKSHARAKKVVHNFAQNTLYYLLDFLLLFCFAVQFSKSIQMFFC